MPKWSENNVEDPIWCPVCQKMFTEDQEYAYYRTEGEVYPAHIECGNEDDQIDEKEAIEALVTAFSEAIERTYEENQNEIYAHSVPYDTFDESGLPEE